MKRSLLCFLPRIGVTFAAFLACSVARASLGWSGPTSAASGAAYSGAVYSTGYSPGEPHITLYKKGAFYASGIGGVSFSSIDTGPQVVGWSAGVTYYSNGYFQGAESSNWSITINAPNIVPYQSLDSASYSNGTISCWGWAADIEDHAPISHVYVYLDGIYKGSATLGGERLDVANVLQQPTWRYSGFSFSFSGQGVTPGTHHLVTRAIDSGGAYSEQGKDFTVTNTAPTGTISATANAIYAGQSVTFTITGHDVDGNLTALNMDGNGGHMKIDAGPYTFNGTMPNNGGMSFAATGSKSQACTVTFTTPGTYNFCASTCDSSGWHYSSPVYINVASRPTTFMWNDEPVSFIGVPIGIHANYSIDSAHGDSILETQINVFDANGTPIAYPNGGSASTISYTLTPTMLGDYVYSVYIRTSLEPGWVFLANKTVTVYKQEQTISFASIPNHTYGDGPVALSASASSGLPVSFTIFSGLVEISGSTLTIDGAGFVVLHAYQGGNDVYQGTAIAIQDFWVNPAPLTITANNATRTYGAANPALTATYAGLVNGDTSAAISGLSLTTSATTNSGPGTYAITPSGAINANYAITQHTGTLTVNPAPLTIKANNLNKTYGAANPALTATYTGFVNGDTSAVVSGLSLSTTATASSGAGTYTITASGATATNYSITQQSGTLTINKATLAAPSVAVATAATPIVITYGDSWTPAYLGATAGAGACMFSVDGQTPFQTQPWNTTNRLNPSVSLPYTYTFHVGQLGNTNWAGDTNDDLVGKIAVNHTAYYLRVEKADQSAVTLSPSAPSPIYAGDALTFTASGGGFGGYTWSGTSGASGTGSTKSVTFNRPGSYTVTVVSPGDNNHNPSSSASTTVTVTAKAPGLYVDAVAGPAVYGGDVTGSGWALDYKDGAPITVKLFVDGTERPSTVTNGLSRADVQNASAADHWSLHDVTYSGWTFAFNTAGLSAGNHTLYLVASNSLGLTATSATSNFTVLTPPPVVTSIVASTGLIHPGQTFRPRVTATSSTSNLGSIHIYSGPPAADYNDGGSGSHAQAFVPASGPSTTADGNAVTAGSVGSTYTFYARAQNSDGSTSAAYGPVVLTSVALSPNTITFNQPPDKLVGDGSFSPAATASSGLPVSFTIVSGPATASGSSVSLTGATGAVVIRATQAGNADYLAAAPVERTFHVYLAEADQDSDGVSNQDERTAGTSMLDYNSRTSTLGQTIPAGWPNIASTTKTEAVGLTAGQLSVDKSGALTYSVPIWVSPGTAGMQPKLALNYSSQAGAGIAGYGWSLSGLSVITRGPQTRAVDGNIHGVDFTAQDRFYLDGQRLVNVGSGVYGAANTEYRTEIDSFTKVVSYGSAGTGPGWFKAWTKAGLIIEFGNTANAAAEAQGRSEVMTWAVNKITDTAGNYMTFTYAEDSAEGEQRLTRIDYTGNGTMHSPYASVRFGYEARTDVFKGYVAGSKVARTQRLKTIGAYYGETAVRTYTLNYTERAAANARTLLTSISESAADSTAYPALEFAYEAPTGGWETESSMLTPFPLAVAGSETGAGIMDLNGDSYSDFVRTRRDNSTVFTNDAYLNVASGTGWHSTPSTSPALPDYKLPGVMALAWEDRADAGSRFVDLDGDGLTDILFACLNHDGTTSYAARNTGSGWADYSEAALPSGTYISANDPVDSGRRLVDVNGDGLPDLVWNTSSSDRGCLINNSHGQFQAGGPFWVPDSRWTPPFEIMKEVTCSAQFFDVNGDGLPDLIQYGDTEAGVAINSSTGWGSQWNRVTYGGGTLYSTVKSSLGTLGKYLPPVWLSKDGTGWTATPIGSEVADLNGDGLADILMSNPKLSSSFGARQAWLNTGNGWVASTAYAPPAGVYLCGRTDGGETDATGAVVADINGDGLPDLAVHRSDQTTSRVYYLNTGHGWGTVNTSYLGGGIDFKLPHAIVNGSLATPTGTQLADLNGDGIVDSVTNGSPYTGTWPVLNKARPTADRLIKVTNGFGVEAAVTYALLTERDATGPTVYTKGSGSTYPVADVTAPMYVVKTVTNDDGVGGEYSIDYRYGGLRTHALYGSLGFETMTTIDDRTGIVSVTSFRQDFPYIGMPLGSVTIAPAPTTADPDATVTLSSSATTYDQKLLNAGKTHFVFAKTVETTSRDLNGDTVAQSVTTTQRAGHVDYDDYGNSLYVSVDSGDGYTKTTESTYTNDTTHWFLGRLSASTVTATAPGQPTLARASSFGYDPVTGLLTTETVEPDDATADLNLKLTTTYGYDAFGNKQTVTVTGRDGTSPTDVSRVTTTIYDARGRFPDHSSNALDQTESYTYDQNLGVVKSLTGPNDLPTTWDYDGFGTKIRETRADTTVTETRVKWAGAGAPAGAVYLVETESTGGAPALVFHDAFGRAIRSLGINGDGEIVYQDTAYDAMSRASASSVPYRNDGSTIYWTQTTAYDLLNRPLTTVTPDDDRVAGGTVTTSFAYKGLTTEVTDANGRVARSVKNTQGQVVQAIRNAAATAGAVDRAEVTYVYDAYGNLTSTTASGVTTTMSYDVRGRKVGMADPDMGAWSYHYNAFGELISQTDAKNQTTTMTYDALGRLKTRVEAEGTTTWTYDTVVRDATDPQDVKYWIGKLASVSAPGSYGESYTYDTLGRPATVTRTIDGTAYAITQQYDSAGRPEKTVYPTGFQIKNAYNEFGALDEVRRADGTHTDLYWQADHYAVDGRVDGETYGNGLTNDRVYSKSTGRLLVAAVGLAPANDVQYLQYTYDAIGNVATRENTWKATQGTGYTTRTESFVYDALDRLTKSTVAGSGSPEMVDLTYYANGNLHTKSDVGTYAYSGVNAGPHAMTGVSGGPLGAQTYAYDANGNMTSGGGRVITWTSFNQAKTITGAGGHHSTFFFGAAHERVKQVSDTATTIYVGGIFEKVTDAAGGGIEEKNYIMTPTGRVAVATFGTAVPVGGTVQYFHTDGLGSITAVTDENGAIVKRFAYDSWGKQIDPDTGSAITSSTNGHVTRGYTDHEMLADLGLVHMNGRIYDPMLGRFLSADPNVDGTYDSQGYNRYSYVGNNPMNRIDPSGYFKLKDLFMVSHYTNPAYWISPNLYRRVEPAIRGIVVTAILTYASWGVGATWAATAGGAVSSFESSLLNGGSVGDAFKSGIIGGAIGGASAYAVSTISSGIKAGMQDVAQSKASVIEVSRNPVTGEIITKGVDRSVLAGKASYNWINGMRNSSADAIDLSIGQMRNYNHYYIIYNESHGFLADLYESSVMKLTGTSSISRDVADIMQTMDLAHSTFVVHSQAGLIINNAVTTLAQRGISMQGMTVSYNGAAVSRMASERLLSSVGATMGYFQSHSGDLVPNIIGGNALWPINPVRFGLSILEAPLLFAGKKLSPHTIYIAP
jgi:RHS repeat-associated protein